MKKILFISACVREDSRTKALAEHLLGKLSGEVCVIDLSETPVPPLSRTSLAERDHAIAENRADAPILQYAEQFAAADEIVIAAPFWDLSAPALLRSYLEAVTASGVTFRYSENGHPQGLCRAQKLWYVTTAGGPIITEEYSYGYVRTLCNAFYGIPKTAFIKAEGLDIWGADPQAILKKAISDIDACF